MARLKKVEKWAWLAKPHESAIMTSGSSVRLSRSQALCEAQAANILANRAAVIATKFAHHVHWMSFDLSGHLIQGKSPQQSARESTLRPASTRQVVIWEPRR